MKKLLIPLLSVEAGLWLAFLWCDITGFSIPLSSGLKYAGLLLCLLLAALLRPWWASRRDGIITLCALGLTAVADIFLLFTGLFGAGVAVFCCAHLAWLLRYRRKAYTPAAVCAVVAAGASLVLYLLGLHNESLLLLCALYAALILSVTVFAFRASLGRPARILVRVGMVLFLLCDVNVVLFNTLAPGPLFQAAAVLMWFFYLPAQLLLALSCIGPSPSPPAAGSPPPP